MSQPFVGEIRMFGGTFAPAGWAFCAGQLMPISQNETLFNLIGTTYGGDGQETFAVPDLQGRAPMHFGQGPGISQTYQEGEKGGVESVTITTNSMPIHNHAFIASGDPANSIAGTDGVLAAAVSQEYLYAAAPNINMNASMVSQVGGSQPHENMQPYLAITFIISLFGIFPHQ